MTKCKAELAGLTKVRITHESCGWPVGSVVWHDELNCAYNDNMSRYHYHTVGISCEIVKDEVMYKVGDKVRIVAVEHGHLFKIGEVVTIMEVGEDDYTATNGYESWFLADAEIEHYTATTFQVGETYTTAAGHANKCIHIENGIAWCVSARDDGTAYGPAYTWDMEGNYLNAPPSECAPYKITFGPTIERKTVIASVDYVDGEPDWETVEVVG